MEDRKMKARVKATGEIKEVELNYIGDTPVYMDKDGVIYKGLYDLDFNVEEESLPKDEPDYWEKLKHQATISAMQGILINNELLTALCAGNKEVPICKMVADNADLMAIALIDKLKEESKCEK
jgi:hypothetical protein